MPEFPPLGMPDIRAWAGDRSFELGRRYMRDGSVLRPRRQDHSRTLKARVRGTAPRPYRVEVSLNDHGIAAGECSCPVGDRKSTRLNSSHPSISYAVFCLKK